MSNNNNGTGVPMLSPAAIRRSNERNRARMARNLYVETSAGYMQMERQKALEALARKLSPYKGSKNNRNAAIRALEAARKGSRANRNVNRQKVVNWGQRITPITFNTNKELYRKMRQYYISELNKAMNFRNANSRAVKRLEAFAGFKRALGRGVALTGIYSAYGARGLVKAAAAPVRGAALTGRGATGLLQRMKLKAFAMSKKRSPSNYTASVTWKAHVLKLRREQDAANRKVANIEANLKRGISNSELNRVLSKLNGAKAAAARAKELANSARRRKTIPALFPGAPAIPKSGNGVRTILAEVPTGLTRSQAVRRLAARQENLGGRGRPAPVNNVFHNARNNNVENNASNVANNAALAALQVAPQWRFRNPWARRRI